MKPTIKEMDQAFKAVRETMIVRNIISNIAEAAQYAQQAAEEEKYWAEAEKDLTSPTNRVILATLGK